MSAWAAFVCAVGAALMGGCTVGQPAGSGRTYTFQDSALGATCHVYLPQHYRESGPAHPVVVSFHGMKPFDSAGAQILEWQSEADRYGYIVLAPTLRVSAFGSPLPLSDVSGALRDDERSTLAAMDEVFRTTHADPAAVLSTSWSYGGYVAHYMFNRHPDRFSCLAVRQSNFNAELLTDATVGAYAHKPIAVFYTTNDFRICREESQEAALWYARRGFDVTFARFEGRGHERTPGPAAAFFAESCGARASSPPWELAFLQVVRPVTPDEFEPEVRDMESIRPPQAPASPGAGSRLADSSAPDRAASDARSPRAGAATEVPAGPLPLRAAPVSNADTKGPASPPPPDRSVVSISASPLISITPLQVTFRAFVPPGVGESAVYEWWIDDKRVGLEAAGQATLSAPGEYQLRLTVTDRAGRTYTANKALTVLERAQPGRR